MLAILYGFHTLINTSRNRRPQRAASFLEHHGKFFMHMRIKFGVFFFSVAFIFCSCSRWLKPNFTQKPPKKEDLVGVWTPDKETLSVLARIGGYKITAGIQIVLHNDGKLEMLNMPDWWGGSGNGESRKGFKSYSGTWEVSQRNNYITIGIDYSDGYTELDLLNDSPPYKIELIVGDPDENRSMIFIRQGDG